MGRVVARARGARRLDREIAARRLAVCEMTALELLYSARNSSDYLRLGTAPEALPWAATDGAAIKELSTSNGSSLDEGNTAARYRTASSPPPPNSQSSPSCTTTTTSTS
jgi:predicted nucleic acid-binding protein